MSDHMHQDAVGAPTPLAVPWTPPAQPTHVQPMPAQLVQAPAPSAPMAAPQPYPAAAQTAPQPYAPVSQGEPHMQAQPYSQPIPAPQLHSPAPQPMHQPGYPQIAQQYAQPEPAGHAFPPMPMDGPVPASPDVPESKSLFAKLLKRKPKADGAEPAAQNSKSLFDKNFVFGLAAGLVLGFLVLPMVFGGGAEPAQSYTPTAQLSPPQATSPVIAEGEAFVDTVLAEDAP